MSTNSIGTIIRITGIFFTLVGFWLLLVSLCYFLLCTVFSLEFSFTTDLLLFGIFLIFRMFYPKNVFV